MLKPLAPYGNSKSSNTNLSRSISMSIVDENQNEVPVRTLLSDPIEILIPRDPQLFVSPMIFQNVTSMNSTPHHFLFHLHYVNLSSSLPVSVHWEIQPLNITLAYLLIYRFDQIPKLNNSISDIDGWTLLCPSSELLSSSHASSSSLVVIGLTNDSIHRYFIDNQRTEDHQAVVVGLRELSSNEMTQVCSTTSPNTPPITNDRVNFTSDYQLRTYTSGCYYLDGNNQWKADGLKVRQRFCTQRSSKLDLGGSIDQSLSNAVLLHSSDYFCGWICRLARSGGLELCLCQCGFHEEQNCLSHSDHCLRHLSHLACLCPSLR